MQAVEKITENTSWIPIVLVILFSVIAVLKIIDTIKLKGYVFAIFNKGFVEDEVEEDTSIFSYFYSLLFLFFITVLSLALHFIISIKHPDFTSSFTSFLKVFLIVLCYFSAKRVLENAIASLFLIKKHVRYYMVSNFGFQYSLSFILLIGFILFQFSPLKPTNFLYFTIALYLFRLIFLVRNNKNLIFSELFYFILYICAFEIAPLLTLFKLML
ncbi:DUF4271 domain-containing protein [uncultured Polaribacter sp.]|uniref:DUF4271 domain-containing protein n=1 Tax=uncultured Polaribacter sp. TaxID=174711 RepID=UPI00261791D2|nr:DUF4271 domain-containing protein [uncultured Polaribacter sp.]